MSLRRTRVFVRASALFVAATEFGAGEDRVVRRHPRVSLRGTTVIANSSVLRSVRRVERARDHGLRGEASVIGARDTLVHRARVAARCGLGCKAWHTRCVYSRPRSKRGPVLRSFQSSDVKWTAPTAHPPP